MTDGANVTRILMRVAIGVGALVVVLVAGAAWSVFTKSGRRVVLCKVRDSKLEEVAAGQDWKPLLARVPRPSAFANKGPINRFLYLKMNGASIPLPPGRWMGNETPSEMNLATTELTVHVMKDAFAATAAFVGVARKKSSLLSMKAFDAPLDLIGRATKDLSKCDGGNSLVDFVHDAITAPFKLAFLTNSKLKDAIESKGDKAFAAVLEIPAQPHGELVIMSKEFRGKRIQVTYNIPKDEKLKRQLWTQFGVFAQGKVSRSEALGKLPVESPPEYRMNVDAIEQLRKNGKRSVARPVKPAAVEMVLKLALKSCHETLVNDATKGAGKIRYQESETVVPGVDGSFDAALKAMSPSLASRGGPGQGDDWELGVQVRPRLAGEVLDLEIYVYTDGDSDRPACRQVSHWNGLKPSGNFWAKGKLDLGRVERKEVPGSRPGVAADARPVPQPTRTNPRSKPVAGDADDEQMPLPATPAPILFNSDSYALSVTAKLNLAPVSAMMKQNPSVVLQIEGHASAKLDGDQNSIEYSLALGERRAQAVKNHLVELGVEGERLSTISYGQEKPEAFSDVKQRRVQIRVSNR